MQKLFHGLLGAVQKSFVTRFLLVRRREVSEQDLRVKLKKLKKSLSIKVYNEVRNSLDDGRRLG